MKKRLFALAVVIGLVLSMTAYVWAGTPAASKLDNVVAAWKKKYNVNTTSGSSFTIPVQVQITAASSTLPGYTAGKADKVTYSFSASPSSSFENVVLADAEKNINITDTDTFPYSTNLTGKAKGNGTITVTGKAYIGSNELGSMTATIDFTTEAGDDEVDPSFMTDGPNPDATKVNPSDVDGTAGDPDGPWDGKDPTFGTLGGNEKDKPKVATSKLVFNGTGGSKGKYTATSKTLISGASADFEVEIKGPGPRIDVYVAAKDTKKLWPLSCDKKYNGTNADWATDIRLTKENIKKWGIPFRVTATSFDLKTPASQDKNTKHKLTIAYNGAEVAYKGFPLTIAVSNDKTTKAVTKTYKIDIVSSRQVPQWVTGAGVVGDKLSKKNAQEISVALKSGGTLGGVIYTVSADGPYYITAKGDKIGISSDVHQPVLNKYGEVTTAGYVKVYGTFDSGTKGTKDGTKESKVAFTLDAVGNVKKTSFKPTVIGKVSPYFDKKDFVTSKDKSYAGLPNNFEDYTYYKAKTAEAGKVPSVAFKAKGSKTITYSISNEDLAELNAVGLSFDKKSGKVVQLTSGGTKVPTKATSDDGDYDPVEITVTAANGTGYTASATALVGVTGEKAKVFLGTGSDNREIKNLVIPVNAAAGTFFTIGAKVGKAQTMTTSGDKTVNVQFRPADAKKAKEGGEELEVGEDTYKLEGLGLEFISSSEFDTKEPIGETDFKDYYRNLGVIKATGEQVATKGTKVNLIVSNLGNEQKGSLTIVIQDPKPVISADKNTVGLVNGQAVKVNLTLSEGAPSNSAKITWKIADKLSGSEKNNINVKLSNPKEGKATDYTKATLEVTAKNNKVKGTVNDKLTITAQNSESKLTSEKFTITVTSGDTGDSVGGASVSATVVRNGTAGSPADAGVGTDADDEAEVKLTFGAPRTAANLTVAQKAFLATKGYTVIAVLPEVTADKDGQAEIAVELIEDAPKGAKLVYVPFPKNAAETDDDKIADFYDEDGASIENIPAGKNITVAPWFRAGVTYEPVIAAENK